MSLDLKAKLAELAARMAESRERLARLGETATSVREEIERLSAGEGEDDDFSGRIPTRPMGMPPEDPSRTL